MCDFCTRKFNDIGPRHDDEMDTKLLDEQEQGIIRYSSITNLNINMTNNTHHCRQI